VFAPFRELIECTRSKEASVSGEVRTSLKPRFDLSWDRGRKLRTAIQGATALVEGRVEAVAEALAEQAVDCRLGPVPLLRPEWPAVVLAGPVPVPVTLSLPINLSAGAMARGKARVEAHAEIHGTLGIEYRGKRPRGIYEAPKPSAGIDPEVETTASTNALIGPVATIEIGWRAPGLGRLAARAEIGIYSGIRVTYDVRRRPQIEACVPLEVTAAISLFLPLRREPLSKRKTLEGDDITCRS
jgi:hypothetical protein